MTGIPNIIPVSQLRDNLDGVMQIVDEDEPLVLTHRGKSKCVLLSVDRFNTISALIRAYEDSALIQRISNEMEADYLTVEQAEKIFRKDGLLE